MGVDVQETEIYYVIRAWALKDELLQSWVISWGVIGSFDELAHVAMENYPGFETENVYRINAAGIDSRYRTSEVYQFCSQYNGFLPIKGFREVKNETGSIPFKKYIINQQNPSARNNFYFMINTQFFKEKIFAEINQAEGLPRIFHLPKDVDATFLRHIASERQIKKRNASGQWVRYWVTKKGYSANHYLDCVVYAEAMANMFGVNSLKPGQETKASGRRVRSSGVSLGG